jgi:hypothetical protein
MNIVDNNSDDVESSVNMDQLIQSLLQGQEKILTKVTEIEDRQMQLESKIMMILLQEVQM